MLRQAWVVLVTGCLAAAAGADPTTLSQAEAEARLTQLKTAIGALQDELTRSRAQFRSEQAALRTMDMEIQAAALSLREVETRIGQQQSELDRLRADRKAYLAALGERSEQLSQHVAAAYRTGRESRLKLLLNQDDPARIGRMLAYFDYFSEVKARQIRELRVTLDELERLQENIDQALAGLRLVQDERRLALEKLEGGRQERSKLLDQLGQQIDDDESLLQELQQNQSDLEALLKRLAEALADLPSDLGQYQHPRERRGQLPMPLDGRVQRAFGQDRTGGMTWQGWLIGAATGAEVQAVAYGRVAYADWLRGYGLLIIIDHGDGFMSLYGNNESLLFEPGDWVQPGEVIATVGSNAGSDQGLYFELRNNGAAIDPAGWIKRR